MFTNNLGSEIVIEVKQSAEDTAKLIATVLEGKESAAHLLADLIHDKTFLEEDELQLLEKDLDFDLPLTNLGIWVDPIGEYYSSNYISQRKEKLREHIFRMQMEIIMLFIIPLLCNFAYN